MTVFNTACSGHTTMISKALDYLINGRFLQHATDKTQVKLAEHGLVVRRKVMEAFRRSANLSSDWTGGQPLNEQIVKDLQKPGAVVSFGLSSELANDALTVAHSVDQEERLKSNTCAQGVRSLSMAHCPSKKKALWFQDFVRCRRSWWKKAFVYPDTVMVQEHQGPSLSASIRAIPDLPTFEFIRLMEPSECQLMIPSASLDNLQIIESQLLLNEATLSLLVSSVKQRLFLKSTKLGLHKDLVPFQFAVAALRSDPDSLDFKIYIELLLEKERLQVWRGEHFDPPALYEITDRLGIPLLILITATTLEDGVLWVRDRDSTIWTQLPCSEIVAQALHFHQHSLL